MGPYLLQRDRSHGPYCGGSLQRSSERMSTNQRPAVGDHRIYFGFCGRAPTAACRVVLALGAVPGLLFELPEALALDFQIL